MKSVVTFILVINSVFAREQISFFRPPNELLRWRPLYRQIENVEIVRGPPIRCIITGSRPKPDVLWRIGDRQIPDMKYSTYISKESPLITVSDLKIELTEQDKLNTISCFAENPAFPKNIFSAALDLAVSNAASYKKVEKVKILEGTPTRCIAIGSKPAPKIVWYIDGDDVPAEKYTTTFNETTSIATSVLDMTFSEAGREVQLSCAAINPNLQDNWSWQAILVRINDLSPSTSEDTHPHISDTGSMGMTGLEAATIFFSLRPAPDVCGEENEEEETEEEEQEENPDGSSGGDGGGGGGLPLVVPIVPFTVVPFVLPPVISGLENDDNNEGRFDVGTVMKTIHGIFDVMKNTSDVFTQTLERAVGAENVFKLYYNTSVHHVSDYGLTLIGLPQPEELKEANIAMRDSINNFGTGLVELLTSDTTTKLLGHLKETVNDIQSKITEFNNTINRLTSDAKAIKSDYSRLIDEMTVLATSYIEGITDCLNDDLIAYEIDFEDITRAIVDGINYMDPLIDRLDIKKDKKIVWTRETQLLNELIEDVNSIKESINELSRTSSNVDSCTYKLRDTITTKTSELIPIIEDILVYA